MKSSSALGTNYLIYLCNWLIKDDLIRGVKMNLKDNFVFYSVFANKKAERFSSLSASDSYQINFSNSSRRF
jgi:hypothetical protein